MFCRSGFTSTFEAGSCRVIVLATTGRMSAVAVVRFCKNCTSFVSMTSRVIYLPIIPLQFSTVTRTIYKACFKRWRNYKCCQYCVWVFVEVIPDRFLRDMVFYSTDDARSTIAAGDGRLQMSFVPQRKFLFMVHRAFHLKEATSHVPRLWRFLVFGQISPRILKCALTIHSYSRLNL